MPPHPRRRSSAKAIGTTAQVAVIVACVAGIVGAAVLLHDQTSARDDADRLRAIRGELDDAIREQRRVEAGIRSREPALGDQPEHVWLPRYLQDAGWQAAALRVTNLVDERRRILGRQPNLGP